MGFTLARACALLCMLNQCSAMESVWALTIKEGSWGQYFSFPNYLYKNSFVSVSLLCNSGLPTTRIRVDWVLEEIECMQQLYNPRTAVQQALFDIKQARDESIRNRNVSRQQRAAAEVTSGDSFKFQLSMTQEFTCGQSHQIRLKDEANLPYSTADIPKHRDVQGPTRPKNFRNIQKQPYNSTLQLQHRVARAWADGMYHFLLAVSLLDPNDTATAAVWVEMRGEYGYLPAIGWPLLPYSGVMSMLYLAVGTIWILVWAWAHRNSDKIHIVIGAVAVSGALTHTLMFSDISATNSNGKSIATLGWSVIVLGLVQDSIVQLLLVVVSTGYGITRYSLGRTFIGLAVGLAVASLASGLVFSVTDAEHLRIKYDHHTVWLYAQYVHATILIVTAALIMASSIATFVHLCTRRHARKTVTFSVFTAICFFSFIAKIVLLCLISIRNGFLGSCTHDWKHTWLVLSAGKMSNFVLLVFLMWLWRPTDEGRSYDFAPLPETEDEPDEKDAEKIALEPL